MHVHMNNVMDIIVCVRMTRAVARLLSLDEKADLFSVEVYIRVRNMLKLASIIPGKFLKTYH